MRDAGDAAATENANPHCQTIGNIRGQPFSASITRSQSAHYDTRSTTSVTRPARTRS